MRSVKKGGRSPLGPFTVIRGRLGRPAFVASVLGFLYRNRENRRPAGRLTRVRNTLDPRPSMSPGSFVALGFCLSPGLSLRTQASAITVRTESSRPRVYRVLTRPIINARTSPPTDVEDATNPLTPGSWDGSRINPESLISAVKFDVAGLVPAVAQQFDTGEVLMVAWMNAESIAETLRGGCAVYYSRSRKALWRKGDTSGQMQVLCDVLLDCDGDTLVLKVDQKGVACHTGRRSCFYNAYRAPTGERTTILDVLTDPKELYGPG
jgi:phosphoribosyl-AMP cyclohydrolase